MATKTGSHLPIEFLLGVASLIHLPQLFCKGMFLDGLIYGAISQNLSKGIGSTWSLWYDGLNAGVFKGQLPLFMWLESYAFRVFGTSHFVERVFCLLLLLLTLYLFNLLISIIIGHRAAWFGTLLLLITPRFNWVFANNMIESLLLPLVLTTFLLLYNMSLGINRLWHLPVIGALAFATFLTKGPVALGILALPLAFSPSYGIRKGLSDAAIACSYFGLGIAGLILYNPSNQCIADFFAAQVLGTINYVPSGSFWLGHFTIVLKLLGELIVPLGIGLLLGVLFRKKLTFTRTTAVLLLTALLFSLPFALFKKQHVYYTVPSFPFYILLVVHALSPSLQLPKSTLDNKLHFILAPLGWVMILIGIGLGIWNYGNYTRDKHLITDLQVISQHTKSVRIGIDKDLAGHWSIFAYATRYQLADFSTSPDSPFLVSARNVVDGYSKVDVPTVSFHLFEKQAP